MMALLRGELLKLSRQPAILFWGFLAAPLFSLLFKAATEGFVLLRSGFTVHGGADVLLSGAKSLGISGNSLAQLLYAMGVASVFFNEYRFSTWRLLVPRTSRTHLLAAKFFACLICLAASLLLTLFGDLALRLALSFLGPPILPPADGPASGVVLIAAAFATAFLELGVLAALVSAITIATRSLIAAVIPAFLLPIAATLLQIYLGQDDGMLPLTSIAADAIRNWLFSAAPSLPAIEGLGILILWLIAAASLACLIFHRQELASE
ncbi:hypothetical protein [Oryzifoliimicrobium ureilyticus]|uniref:hypothetical protein n=1 Tax=Oryzifoliimicrobium ureilyticus TaxID=3113724 RepID=UPI0030766A20